MSMSSSFQIFARMCFNRSYPEIIELLKLLLTKLDESLELLVIKRLYFFENFREALCHRACVILIRFSIYKKCLQNCNFLSLDCNYLFIDHHFAYCKKSVCFSALSLLHAMLGALKKLLVGDLASLGACESAHLFHLGVQPCDAITLILRECN